MKDAGVIMEDVSVNVIGVRNEFITSKKEKQRKLIR